MNRVFAPIALLLSLTVLAGCQKEEAAPPPPAALVAPTDSDDAAWKAYLGQVVNANQAGVTDRIFPYYLPMNSAEPAEGDQDGKTQYDRQLENVTAVVQRTVLPGNLLAFGSPDSAKMADLIVAAFANPDPNALKGSQVLFIGKPADSDRVKAAVEAAGGKYIFVEAK
ncbi:hypothetical protein [Arenimonas sp. MALMAid1274]|uniref:hypothetical protein n=1 Tax=Arenimonas sp. MALMAid1274 TaxID=3411630 RepID=UPI003B9E4F53